MIQVENLTKYYGESMAVEDVSFDVKPGEILGFLGPNGAGKTTTMRIMTCFMAPTSGTAKLAGHDILEDSMAVRRDLGYLPESVPLYREMTVRGYLHYCAKLRGVPRGDRETAVNDAIAKARCEEVADTIIRKCSRGFRQRVGIAQALVHNPKVLVLDEPTLGLDPNQIIQTRRLIKNLAGDHTIIISTHILPEVSMTCDRVVIIDAGTIVAEDTPDGLTRQLRRSEVTRLVLARPSEDALDKLRSVEHVLSAEKDNGSIVVESELDHDVRENLAACVVEGGWGLLEMTQDKLSLEDIFLQLTTDEEEVAA